ncbi:MAG: metallophosphoesterase, partial [Acidimicrobiales bacterium]
TKGEPVFGRDADERLAAVLAAWTATGERADLVLLTGDLADDGSADGCARLAEAVARLDAPVLAIPGNHDRPAVVASMWDGPRTASVGEWLVAGIDTTVPGEVHGDIDVPAVMAWLDTLDRGPMILALHHPPMSRSTADEFRLDGAAELLAALAERPHVRAVVGGHLHDAVDLEAPSGLAVLGCPSTIVGITHDGDRMEIGGSAITGARVLTLDDDGTFTSRILQA